MSELIASAITSTLLGLVSIQVRQYQYWRAWIVNLFWAGLGLYLALNAILGVLAVSLAHAASWQPVHRSAVWSGVMVATVAQGAIRIELPRVFSENLSSGSSLLRRLVIFVFDFLNEESDKAIQRRLDGLGDDQLIALALYVHSRYVEQDPEIPEKTRKVLLQSVTEAAQQIGQPEGGPAGRGALEYFCINQLVGRRLRPLSQLPEAGEV